MPRIAGGRDIITQPLYDTQQYPAAGTANPISFFGTPKGQGTTLFGAGTKNLTDTNMRAAAQLPSPWTFEIYTVQAFLFSAEANPQDALTMFSDIAAVFNAGNLVLEIGSKWFLEIPLAHLPGGAGIDGVASQAGAVAATQIESVHSGLADPRAVYILASPITILENENFEVRVTVPGAPAPTAAVNIRCYLGGQLARSIQ